MKRKKVFPSDQNPVSVLGLGTSIRRGMFEEKEKQDGFLEAREPEESSRSCREATNSARARQFSV